MKMLLFGKLSSTEPEIIVPVRKRLGSELIGTFALVFTAVGSDVSDALNGHVLGKFAVPILILQYRSVLQ
jgi:glycerol uptake facilitator-like aquaporin